MTPAWVGLLATAVAVELYALRRAPESTLSALTRKAFRTDTEFGRVVFAVALAAGAAWFCSHIIEEG